MLTISLAISVLAIASLCYVCSPLITGNDSQGIAHHDHSEDQISIKNLEESLSDLHLDYALQKMSASDFTEQKTALEDELHGRTKA